MIYVDSNVPMYLVGAAHPNKQRVIELVPQLLGARDVLVTSAETFQEIVHRYVHLADRRHLDAAYEALESLVSRTVDVTKADVDLARSHSGHAATLSSRDCLHLAIMRRVGCRKVWTYDRGFDAAPGIVRVE
ncbi:MAG: type II toxin-antitoxin system VapC family toxin [Deltaproteobacteria bacterium]|nr:type II toxin-antitoxin system VapC family toxin [Deltaproteobacteria bacterium]